MDAGARPIFSFFTMEPRHICISEPWTGVVAGGTDVLSTGGFSSFQSVDSIFRIFDVVDGSEVFIWVAVVVSEQLNILVVVTGGGCCAPE